MQTIIMITKRSGNIHQNPNTQNIIFSPTDKTNASAKQIQGPPGCIPFLAAFVLQVEVIYEYC